MCVLYKNNVIWSIKMNGYFSIFGWYAPETKSFISGVLRYGSPNNADFSLIFLRFSKVKSSNLMRFVRISRFLRRIFFANFLRFFGFLSLLLARSRRAVANLDERVKKFIHTAFVWPVEVGEILMRLLILKVNKLVWIITRRKWLVSKIALGDQ